MTTKAVSGGKLPSTTRLAETEAVAVHKSQHRRQHFRNIALSAALCPIGSICCFKDAHLKAAKFRRADVGTCAARHIPPCPLLYNFNEAVYQKFSGDTGRQIALSNRRAHAFNWLDRKRHPWSVYVCDSVQYCLRPLVLGVVMVFSLLSPYFDLLCVCSDRGLYEASYFARIASRFILWAFVPQLVSRQRQARTGLAITDSDILERLEKKGLALDALLKPAGKAAQL